MEMLISDGSGKPIQTTIGAYADYFRYDPDGLFGPPTLRNPKFEDAFFGREVMAIYRKEKHA